MKDQTQRWEDRTRKNTRQLGLWTGAWVLTTAIAAFGPKFLWNENTVLSALAILLTVVVGIGMVFMNRKYINALDEMQRKVTMDAMAIALGIAVVVGLAYSMLDVTNVIAFDAEISHLVILIGITYLAGVVIGNSRYK
ncbi:MFS transporter [Salinimicrobium oceani]|uniref:MFS transporter n=1 Tax=Salinimicrobium oceani TaxID=2722702 RepID=A0ABX1D1P5_9FLAO|nr:MFS transporter [Salinimicrobium oceani]NJW52466.1 MFS transporter [Salinimicrobium oceani]